jgi:hypothetical protein
MPEMKNLWLALALFVGSGSALFGNGGAWQTGIPVTGNASSSKSDRHTDVTIENETLKIDLHPEQADVTVRYRMHNTGPKVQQEFFFPVERWGRIQTPDEDRDSDDIDHYQISVDGKELKWINVAGPKTESSKPKEGSSEEEQETSETKQGTSEPNQESSDAKEGDSEAAKEDGEAEEERAETPWEPAFQDDVSTIKSWKKSVIPFERNQTREVTVRYNARYSENNESVSDDLHMSNSTFAYSLSPAATWKGSIGKGKVELNILHPDFEDVSIKQPKERFKKISDRRYKWEFESLKPTLADDIRIVAHSQFDSYPTRVSEDDVERNASYVIQGNQYFLDYTDYDAVASSTLAPQGEHHYEVQNIKGVSGGLPWAEGAKDDGIGESITLNVKRPLPLYGILIRPGYWQFGSDKSWKKNNRVAALEITLNDERTFTETIPDETFRNPYLIRVRDYTKPVTKIKMVIKGVHRGTESRDTCISLVQLRAPLSKKPKIQHAR